MSPSRFIELLQAQTARASWLHTLNSPASDVSHLPKGLAALYAKTNGLRLQNMRLRGQDIGTAFEMPTAFDVVALPIAMYGSNANKEESLVPDAWLCVGQDADSTLFAAVDPENEWYYSFNPIAPGESELIAKSIENYLEWLCQFIPSEERLATLLAQSEA